MSADRRKLIAALVEKTGIKLDENDPAFLLVELNLLMQDMHLSNARKVIDAATDNFQETAQSATDDLIKVLNESLAKFKARTVELQNSIDSAENANANLRENKLKLALIACIIFASGIVFGIVIG